MGEQVRLEVPVGGANGGGGEVEVVRFYGEGVDDEGVADAGGGAEEGIVMQVLKALWMGY